ncbi:MAG: M10 family metallopeptidase domain-containing protein [Actinomycetota bacterium]|nr:M10 family metallopeptidase domain-containing protein [Actinomycetota bacterium]
MRSLRRVVALGFAAALVLSTMTTAPAVGAARQNDAASRRDAGNTFDEATAVKPHGYYEGVLDRDGGDAHDFYKFTLPKDASVSVLIKFSDSTIDPVTMLDPSGAVIDVGTKIQGVGVSASAGMTSEVGAVRLAVHRAVTAGDYRLHIQSDRSEVRDYTMCFMNCEGVVDAPIELIFGGSLETPDARVLMVPPSHGDLGNPTGPTVVDYLNATLRGLERWRKALKDFARDYPQFDYLNEVKFHVEVFDGADPVDPAGYDVILGYVAAGPAFRGIAGDTQTKDWVNGVLETVGIRDQARYSGRVIALSLFGSSPRAGQVAYDFPEVNDLEIVTAHEFGHTFGLGHTTTWHPKLGPDLMNSPAPFVYGDGQTIGAGTEHTKMKCLTSLDLYGMAVLYRWIPSGEWVGSGGSVDLPRGIPYRWYC